MKKKKKPIKKKKNNPVHLPPHKPEFVISSLSQSQGWGIKRHKIPNTWTVTQGEGIRIAVIDSGHPVHTDIGDNAIPGKNYIQGEDINDHEGHQTHCTGIICAKNNDSGMVGVAPKAQCISIKALDKNGSGGFTGIVNALKYALKENVDLVSMSLGAASGTPGLEKAIKALYDAGIPVIAAAGNEGKAGVGYPAKYKETIAIAAYDSNGNIANFSSVGDEVDWAAPGVQIYSTYLNNQYCKMSGTSMATPFISGVVALLLAKHKLQEAETGKNDCKTVEQVREHLMKYTVDKGYVGKDKQFGYGELDVEQMILAASCKDPYVPEKTPWYKRFSNWLKLMFSA